MFFIETPVSDTGPLGLLFIHFNEILFTLYTVKEIHIIFFITASKFLNGCFSWHQSYPKKTQVIYKLIIHSMSLTVDAYECHHNDTVYI